LAFNIYDYLNFWFPRRAAIATWLCGHGECSAMTKSQLFGVPANQPTRLSGQANWSADGFLFFFFICAFLSRPLSQSRDPLTWPKSEAPSSK